MSEKLRNKIWNTVFDRGLGALFAPFQIRREELARAQAERVKMLILAQTNQDLRKIEDGQLMVDHRGKLIVAESPRPADTQSFVTAVVSIESARLVEKNVNLVNVLLEAEEIASEQPDQDTLGEPSYEWFERWRIHAQDARSDDLRALWARVLCAESRKQDSVSLRTLDFLRNLSQSDAAKIEKVARLNANGMIIRVFGNPFLDTEQKIIPEEYSFGELIELEELGILSNVNEIGYGVNLRDFGDSTLSRYQIRIPKGKLMIQSDKKLTGFPVNGYRVTKVGLELFGILDVLYDESYLSNIKRILSEKSCTFVLQE